MPLKTYSFKTKKEWLEQRQKGIGGSDVAILFDKSQWQTKAGLLADKKLPIVEQDKNAITGLGSRMERVIIEDFVDKKYDNVTIYNDEMFVNDQYPLLQASLDATAIIDGKLTIIEIKFVNLFGGSKWKSPEGTWALPEGYWMQIQHYMTVLNIKKAIVVAFFQELNDVVEFEVDWDKDFAYQLNIAAIDFMEEVANYTGELQPNIKTQDKPIVLNELKELKRISKEIKDLTIKKKAIQSKILMTYDVGVPMELGMVKGLIYERKTKNGTTKILKVV